MNTPLRWRCAEGHEWEARPSNVTQGTWCPHCAGNVTLTIDDMRQAARARGGECLSKRYINVNTPLRWRCAEGHEWEARPSNVTRGGWCRRCAGRAPKTIGEMREIARAWGGECLSTEYVNRETHLRWRCAEGHEWEAAPAHCGRRAWCPYCAGRPPRTIDDMRDIARERGGECLSRRYVNTLTHLRWRCAEGHEWEATPNNVTRGRWCPHCAGHLPLTIDDMREAARARGGECLSKRYVNRETRLRWRCSEGHEWVTKPANITQGRWCPHCVGHAPLTINDMRETARAKGGECLSRSYRHSRPKLLWRCAAGHEWSAHALAVRAGGWCPLCRKAQRGTIERVREVVARKGGVLLDTKYRGSTAPLRVRCGAGHVWQATAGSLVGGRWCHECWIESQRGQPPSRLTIHDMQEVAAARGGACLSEFYVNTKTKLRWRCHDGHEWDAAPSMIRSGHWCPRCAYRYPGSIDGMRGLAVARGGVCLSDTYHNHCDPLQFRCARGHVFTATGMMVKSGVWCPTCASRTSSPPARKATKTQERGRP